MVEIQCVYQGELRCEAVHALSGTTLNTDAPKDNQGKGESFSPTDLVATAMGTCMLTVMGIAARTLQVDLTHARVIVQKEMVTAPIRRIGKLDVTFHLPAGISVEHRAKLERAALSCPVHQSMHPDIAIPVAFHWA